MAKISPDAMGLDKEEQWYEDHADEFISSPAELRQKLISAAKTTMNKTERMNIRMSKIDMENLKTIANREGLPYQTLVTSIIHKYTAGQLVDLNEARKILQSS